MKEKKIIWFYEISANYELHLIFAIMFISFNHLDECFRFILSLFIFFPFLTFFK